MKLKDMKMFNVKTKTFAQVLVKDSRIASELTLEICRQMDFSLLYLRRKKLHDLFYKATHLIYV